jgi:hypothetical protein
MRSTTIPAVSLLLALAGATACAAPVEMNGFKVNAFAWKNAQEAVVPRASFDMKCPREQLQLTVLHATEDFGGGAPTQLGVTGCGQSAVYVQTFGSGWVANSSGPDAKPAETHTTAAAQ